MVHDWRRTAKVDPGSLCWRATESMADILRSLRQAAPGLSRLMTAMVAPRGSQQRTSAIEPTASMTQPAIFMATAPASVEPVAPAEPVALGVAMLRPAGHAAGASAMSARATQGHQPAAFTSRSAQNQALAMPNATAGLPADRGLSTAAAAEALKKVEAAAAVAEKAPRAKGSRPSMARSAAVQPRQEVGMPAKAQVQLGDGSRRSSPPASRLPSVPLMLGLLAAAVLAVGSLAMLGLAWRCRGTTGAESPAVRCLSPQTQKVCALVHSVYCPWSSNCIHMLASIDSHQACGLRIRAVSTQGVEFGAQEQTAMQAISASVGGSKRHLKRTWRPLSSGWARRPQDSDGTRSPQQRRRRAVLCSDGPCDSSRPGPRRPAGRTSTTCLPSRCSICHVKSCQALHHSGSWWAAITNLTAL